MGGEELKWRQLKTIKQNKMKYYFVVILFIVLTFYSSLLIYCCAVVGKCFENNPRGKLKEKRNESFK